MVVDAVMSLDELLSLKMIGIKKVHGGGLEVGAYRSDLGQISALSGVRLMFLLLIRRTGF